MQRDITPDDLADIQRDLDHLISLGLVYTDSQERLYLTEAGVDALNKINAQTWN